MYSDQITKTYQTRFAELSFEKQFHLLSRQKLMGNPWAAQAIASLRTQFLGGDNQQAWIDRLEQLGQRSPDPRHLNASTERMPYFESYPWLFGYELQLFQLLHAKVQFDQDLDSLLGKYQPGDGDILALAHDPTMLAVLSTYLVDVFYLHLRLLRKDESQLISLHTLKAALAIPLPQANKAQLNTYLLTHCIIAETLFYSRKIPAKKHAYYRELARLLVTIAADSWDLLTLDNKLEVALALRLASVSDLLIQKAVTEADTHYDPKFGYLTDPKMPHKNDLEWAEHRNILYLLVTSKLQQIVSQ